MQPIDLTAPRIVVIQDRGKNRTYTLNPITRPQWQRYFDGIVSTSETIDKENVSTYDNSDASVALVRGAVVQVSGYRSKNGEPIVSGPWRELLPPSHLVSVANVLRSVSREETSEDELTLGGERVEISAIWGVTEDGTSMFRQTGLIHHFNTPTIEHQRRYSRESSRSIVSGGSRTGKTVWRGTQSTLVAIYDELVTGVEGYSVGGNIDLAPDVIRDRMDSYHKVAAAEALFALASVNEQSAAEVR